MIHLALSLSLSDWSRKASGFFPLKKDVNACSMGNWYRPPPFPFASSPHGFWFVSLPSFLFLSNEMCLPISWGWMGTLPAIASCRMTFVQNFEFSQKERQADKGGGAKGEEKEEEPFFVLFEYGKKPWTTHSSQLWNKWLRHDTISFLSPPFSYAKLVPSLLLSPPCQSPRKAKDDSLALFHFRVLLSRRRKLNLLPEVGEISMCLKLAYLREATVCKPLRKKIRQFISLLGVKRDVKSAIFLTGNWSFSFPKKDLTKQHP